MPDEIDISTTTLFSAEDICSRLSVSRSTFDRWRRLKPPMSGGFQTVVRMDMRPSDSTGIDQDSDAIGLTPFPAPSLHVGGNARWTAEAVNTWLAENRDKQNRRGLTV